MTDKKLMPQIRFKGFSGAWEQRKLINLANFSKGKGYTKNDLSDSGKEIILYGQLYTNYQTEITSVDTFVKSDYGAVKSEFGDVIVPGSGETAEDISRASVIMCNDVILGGDLNIIKTDKNKLSPLFLALTISNGKQQKDLIKRAQGKSVVHLHNSDLATVNVKMPKIIEQNKIGLLFKQLDSTIALHQRKLDKLEQLKKGFLQQLFPSNGQKVPVIRFADFTADWEQRKLGEIADIVGGGTPSTAKPEYWNGNIDWYAPAEIGKQRYVSKSIKQITEAGLSNSSAKILPIGTVLFTSRAGIGNTAILTKIGTTNQGFQSIVPKIDLIDSYFIYAKTADLKRYGERTGAGSTFVEVSGKQMSIMPINLPTLIEQKKIGGFFKKADDTIAFHQQRLNALKQLKESLLQKLFV